MASFHHFSLDVEFWVDMFYFHAFEGVITLSSSLSAVWWEVSSISHNCIVVLCNVSFFPCCFQDSLFLVSSSLTMKFPGVFFLCISSAWGLLWFLNFSQIWKNGAITFSKKFLPNSSSHPGATITCVRLFNIVPQISEALINFFNCFSLSILHIRCPLLCLRTWGAVVSPRPNQLIPCTCCGCFGAAMASLDP